MNWYKICKKNSLMFIRVASPHIETNCPNCHGIMQIDAGERVQDMMSMPLEQHMKQDPFNVLYRRLCKCPHCGQGFMAKVKSVGMGAEVKELKPLKTNIFDQAINHNIVPHIKSYAPLQD